MILVAKLRSYNFTMSNDVSKDLVDVLLSNYPRSPEELSVFGLTADTEDRDHTVFSEITREFDGTVKSAWIKQNHDWAVDQVWLKYSVSGTPMLVVKFISKLITYGKVILVPLRLDGGASHIDIFNLFGVPTCFSDIEEMLDRPYDDEELGIRIK